MGDLVDYGPDPAPCVDKIQELQQKGAIVILGNHDLALEHREDYVGYSFKGIRLEHWAHPIQIKSGIPVRRAEHLEIVRKN